MSEKITGYVIDLFSEIKKPYYFEINKTFEICCSKFFFANKTQDSKFSKLKNLLKGIFNSYLRSNSLMFHFIRAQESKKSLIDEWRIVCIIKWLQLFSWVMAFPITGFQYSLNNSLCKDFS